MKILVYTALFFLFFSCTANKSASTNSKKQTPTSNTSQKQFRFFENDEFSIKYPSTWKKIENLSSHPSYTFALKKTINKGFKGSDIELVKKFKGKTKREFNAFKKEYEIDIAKTYVNVSSYVLNDTLTFKKIITNYLNSSYKNDSRFTYFKTNLIKETDDYVIISRSVKIKSNNYATNSLIHYILKNGKAHTIYYTSRDKNYNEYLNDFSTILSSFKIKKTN